MRTQDEIVARIKEVAERDLFGAEIGDLLGFLDYEHAKPWLKPEVKSEEWKPGDLTDERAQAELVDYLSFAWDKAINHRGLSAIRSLSHMRAWLWLLGKDELLAFLETDGNFRPYGTPVLAKISEAFGYEAPEEGLKMARDGSCEPGCEMGCQS